MTPAISVVMPTFNRSALLPRVLEAYETQSGDVPFEIVAADDGSDDGTAEILDAYRPRRFGLQVLPLGRNCGPGQARNAAIAAAGAPLLLIVGDDILPSPGLVARHVSAHRGLPESHWAVLGRTTWPDDLPQNNLMRHVDGPGAQQFSYAHLRHGQDVDFRHFYTSNISLKRALLDGVHPWFDPAFRFAAYEDVELAYRLERSAGLRIRYLETARATHYHYYGIWSFAERQVRCGLMASVFLRLHPELRPRWRVKRARRLARLSALPPTRGFLGSITDAEGDRGEEAALRLGSFCEVHDEPVTDRLYLVLLEYFVLKGLLEGELGADRAQRPRLALLLLGLLPEMARLMAEPDGRALGDTEEGRVVRTLGRRYRERIPAWPRLTRWVLEALRAPLLPGH